MLKLCRVTKVKVLFLALVYVFNFNLFEFSAAILEKGLLKGCCHEDFAVCWSKPLEYLINNLFSNIKLGIDQWAESVE